MSDSKADLEKKIIEDLKKSGFGSELTALNVFKRNDWFVTAGWGYLDPEEGKMREIDIRAGYDVEPGHEPSVGQWTLADVKKTERPWVILGSGVNINPADDLLMGTLLEYGALPTQDHKLYDLLEPDSLIMKKGWKGYGIHEFDKKPNDTSRWYAAFSSLAKASALQISKMKFHKGEHARASVVIVQPTLVLDGLLYYTCLDESGAIQLSEIDAGAVLFPYQTAKGQTDELLIDVVTLGALDAYLVSHIKRLEKIHGWLRKEVQQAAKKPVAKRQRLYSADL